MSGAVLAPHAPNDWDAGQQRFCKLHTRQSLPVAQRLWTSPQCARAQKTAEFARPRAGMEMFGGAHMPSCAQVALGFATYCSACATDRESGPRHLHHATQGKQEDVRNGATEALASAAPSNIAQKVNQSGRDDCSVLTKDAGNLVSLSTIT